MSSTEATVVIEVPVSDAYDMWMDVESFSHFMEGVESVTRIDATHSHWVGEIGGVSREWDATMTEVAPGRRIDWRTTSGTQLSGEIDFEPIGETRSRVTVHFDLEPSGAVESVADAVGLVSHRVQGDLDRFKGMAENRRPESKP